MSVEVSLETPLAEALHAAIQPKLVELGWSTGGADDSALAEYIILMLANGKTQDQIAAELSGDLLSLGPDDPGASDFAQWLFQQVEYLRALEQGSVPVTSEVDTQSAPLSFGQDAEMGDIAEGAENNVPTGPKSMRNGANRNRDKRMFGHLVGAMDRSHDAALHRVRPHGGNERINTHARGAPTGPRAIQGRGGRPSNNRPMGVQGMPPSGATANVMAMTPQQQMELYAMLEQQSRLMANMFTPQQQQMMMANGGQPGMMINGISNGFAQQHSGRSLFDRVQPNPQAHHNGGFKKGSQTVGAKANTQQQDIDTASSAMDVELTPAPEKPSPNNTCKFNLTCKNKDCIYAHQSPAAPPGTAIDITDICSFGAACMNKKCTGRHPSPAQRVAHQSEQDCKFFPNCTNPRCPFRHPTMPLCRNGADCTTANCKFTHVKTMCKFNPCLNVSCPFKHEEGQKRGKFEDKVWVAPVKEHVSERRFVDESNPVEELIVPGNPEATASTELVT